ncbi:MAG TPA: 1-(5-phosphoribosyl)-5-[(5-phosphoribosylamino)methylideneamino]imidazole-4-carboxamide isomerase [Steroidobacteraceae bacterium]|nr:1-(5-phosphoribosyl)-5-[(5-phosphoribosylamino)methylideneamino]imidazole-4-carboxamide isomerase [Steroidobacteraceae bacterium]
MRLIPAIDLKAGRCVRLLRGDFAQETRYDFDPGELVARYVGLGADWIHVVDLDGAADGTPANLPLIATLTRLGAALQVGGGLRDAAAVERMLDLGAARVVVGSAAVTQVERVHEWIERFGSDRVAIAFDVRVDPAGTPRVATHGWRRQSELSLWDAVSAYAETALEHVLCTDVNRDGALSGPNLALYSEAVRRSPRIRWQASGGVRDARDLSALEHTGAAGAVSGKALLDGRLDAKDMQPFLPNA